MFGRIFGVGIKDILNVRLAIGEIQSINIGHRDKKANDGFVGFDVGHRMLRVSRMRVNAELAVNETLDAGLETVFETVLAGSGLIIYSTARKIAAGVN